MLVMILLLVMTAMIYGAAIYYITGCKIKTNDTDEYKYIRITYPDLVKFHSINPNRWVLGKEYAIMMKENSIFRICTFSWKDKMRYNKYRKRQERIEKEAKRIQSQLEMLAEIQKDIESKRQEVVKAYKESTKSIMGQVL